MERVQGARIIPILDINSYSLTNYKHMYALIDDGWPRDCWFLGKMHIDRSLFSGFYFSHGKHFKDDEVVKKDFKSLVCSFDDLVVYLIQKEINNDIKNLVAKVDVEYNGELKDTYVFGIKNVGYCKDCRLNGIEIDTDKVYKKECKQFENIYDWVNINSGDSYIMRIRIFYIPNLEDKELIL